MAGLIVVAILLITVALISRAHTRRPNASRTVRAELQRADTALGREHRRARCDMNDASGQSWRNFTE